MRPHEITCTVHQGTSIGTQQHPDHNISSSFSIHPIFLQLAPLSSTLCVQTKARWGEEFYQDWAVKMAIPPAKEAEPPQCAVKAIVGALAASKPKLRYRPNFRSKTFYYYLVSLDVIRLTCISRGWSISIIMLTHLTSCSQPPSFLLARLLSSRPCAPPVAWTV